MKTSAITTMQERIPSATLVNEPVKISSRFSGKLQQLLWVEKQMASLLPKAKKTASDVKLKAAINSIGQSIAERRTQLEYALGVVNSVAAEKKQLIVCDEFMLLTCDFEPCIDIGDTTMRDAAIIFEIQKMVQFKIEHYSILCELADEFNNSQVSRLAEKILQSEICCDASLMELSVAYLGEDDMLDILED